MTAEEVLRKLKKIIYKKLDECEDIEAYRVQECYEGAYEEVIEEIDGMLIKL